MKWHRDGRSGLVVVTFWHIDGRSGLKVRGEMASGWENVLMVRIAVASRCDFVWRVTPVGSRCWVRIGLLEEAQGFEEDGGGEYEEDDDEDGLEDGGGDVAAEACAGLGAEEDAEEGGDGDGGVDEAAGVIN